MRITLNAETNPVVTVEKFYLSSGDSIRIKQGNTELMIPVDAAKRLVRAINFFAEE